MSGRITQQAENAKGLLRFQRHLLHDCLMQNASLNGTLVRSINCYTEMFLFHAKKAQMFFAADIAVLTDC